MAGRDSPDLSIKHTKVPLSLVRQQTSGVFSQCREFGELLLGLLPVQEASVLQI